MSAAAKSAKKHRPSAMDLMVQTDRARGSDLTRSMFSGAIAIQKELKQSAEVLRETGILHDVEVALIDPDPDNPRRTFSEEAHRELMETIRIKGLINPLVLRPHPAIPGRYMLVCGERRWRAIVALGLPRVEAKIRQMATAEARILQLIENAEGQREGVSAWEEAVTLEKLVAEYGDQVSVMRETGFSKEFLSKRVALSKLATPVAELRDEGILSDVETALALDRLYRASPERALRLIEQARRDGTIRRETVQLAVRAAKNPTAGGRVRQQLPQSVAQSAERIGALMQTRFGDTIKMADVRGGGAGEGGARRLKLVIELADEAALQALHRALETQ